jgi:hypothetical protein
VKPTKKRLVLARGADVDALEAKLWVTFPPGYREYVTRLGEGALASTIRIYPPWRIEKELAGWRRRISKYWFWDEGRDVLPRERALECVVVGDTLNGDELAFHPGRPGELFVLPRDSESVFAAGGDVLSAVEWMLKSDALGGPVEGREFEPFDSREAGRSESDDESADAEGESLDAITDLARRWGERHHARKAAQKAVKQQVKKGQEAKRLYEALVLDGEFTYGSGYTVAYAINDKSGGKTVGVFRWHSDGDSEGSTFEPVK